MTYPAEHVSVVIKQLAWQEAIARLKRARESGDTQRIARAQFAVDRACLEAVRAEVRAGAVR